VATVIASQAVISGAFSISRQAMQLGFMPRMEVQHTSEKEQGQIYLPAVNWGSAARRDHSGAWLQVLEQSGGSLRYCCDRRHGDHLAAGHCRCRQGLGLGLEPGDCLFAAFLSVELVFLAANILKIPDGGWFPLVAGAAVFVLMTTWKRGRQLLSERLQSEEIRLDSFIDALLIGLPTRVPGTAVFMNANPDGVPHALLHNLMHNKVLHERVLLVSVQVFDVPYVPEIDRVEVHKLKGDFYRVIVQYGFKDEPDIPAALALCADAGLHLEMLDTSFFLGRETLIPALWLRNEHLAHQDLHRHVPQCRQRHGLLQDSVQPGGRTRHPDRPLKGVCDRRACDVPPQPFRLLVRMRISLRMAVN
jgi:KUP system potassium uptake protein